MKRNISVLISLLGMLPSIISGSHQFLQADAAEDIKAQVTQNGIDYIMGEHSGQIDPSTSSFLTGKVVEEIGAIANMTCLECHTAFGLLDSALSLNKTQTWIENFAIKICLKHTGYGETICTEMVQRMAPIIINSLTASLLSKEYMCGEILSICDKPVYQKYMAEDAAKNITANKPEIIQNNDYINNIYEKIRESQARGEARPFFTAVQLSDIHMDYTNVITEEEPYGELGWETPYSVLQATVEFIRDELNPDFVLWTGDNSKSDTWTNTQDQVIYYVQNSTQCMVDGWKDTNITIFPIEGNHDTWPVNVQDFSSPGINEALNGFKSSWEPFLDSDQYELFGEYGYYAQPMKLKNGTVVENTKIIAINTQACSHWNWYLMDTRFDPANQLAFLENQLHELELVNGSAVIISHIPPASCLHPYGVRLQAIAERYQHVIKFQAYGHVHHHAFNVVKAFTDPTKNIGITYVDGSLTMQPNNPGLSVIEIDAEFLVPLNFRLYTMNLTQSNVEKRPIWFLQNDYLESYNMTDVSPNSLQALADQIFQDEQLAIEFDWNKYKRGTKLTSCDAQCRRNMYCELAYNEEYAAFECTQQKLNINDAFLDVMMNLFTDPWVRAN